MDFLAPLTHQASNGGTLELFADPGGTSTFFAGFDNTDGTIRADIGSAVVIHGNIRGGMLTGG